MNRFSEYVQMRDLHEYGAGGGATGPPTEMPDRETQMAVAAGKRVAAKAASTGAATDAQTQRELSNASKELKDVKAKKDQQDVTKLVGELDPNSMKMSQAPGTPQMMKRRMKKKRQSHLSWKKEAASTPQKATVHFSKQ